MLFATLLIAIGTLMVIASGRRGTDRTSPGGRRGNFKPIYVYEYSDALQLERVRFARRLRRYDRGKDRRAPPAFDLPHNPTLRTDYTAEAFAISPVDDRRQVALCRIARMLLASGWQVSNAYLVPNVIGMMLHVRIAGLTALRPGKHWLQRRFRDPIVVARADQLNVVAFDRMVATLAANGRQSNFQGLMILSHVAVRDSLPPEQAAEYDRTWR